MVSLKYLLIPVLLLILSIPTALAEQTVKTVEIPMGFAGNVPAGYDAEKVFEFNPPDGLSEVLYVELIIRGDYPNPQTEIRGYITDKQHECIPKKITTPNAVVYNYEATFDCSDLGRKYRGGNVTIMFNFSQASKNVYASARITYYNNPSYSAHVFGTEYDYNELAKVFLQLLDDQKQPIENSTCFVSLFYPNTTIWINEALMTHGQQGLYYYDVFLGDYLPTGVYMASAYCYIPELESTDEWNITATEYFECPSPGNDYQGGWICGEGWITFQNGTETWYFPGTYANISAIDSPYNGSQHMNLHSTSGTGNIDINLTKCVDARVTFWAKANSLETTADGDHALFQMSATGEVNVTWIDVFEWDEDNDDNVWVFYNFSFDDEGVVFGNENEIQWLMDAGSEYDDLWVDDIKIHCRNLTYNYENISEYQIVRGSGEIHLEDRFTAREEYSIIFLGGTEYQAGQAGKVTAQFVKAVGGNPQPISDGQCNVTIFYPNETTFISQANATYLPTSNGIYSYDFTIPTTLGIYTYDFECQKAGRRGYGSSTFHVTILGNVTAEINVSEIWSYHTRTLTDYNFTDILNYLAYINATTTSLEQKCDQMNITLQQIRNFQVNELSNNLTEILIYLEYINTTGNRTYTYIQGLINLSASDVWVYYNRTLTDYNQSYLISLILGLENLTASEVWTYDTRILTDYNHTPILDRIDAHNATIYDLMLSINLSTQDLIKGINQSIWGKLYAIQDEIAGLNNLSASEVWSYFNRTLTFYPTVDPINYSLIQELVWNASNRTLTDFNFTVEINDTAILLAIQNANTSIINQIDAHNNTVMTKLFGLQDEIAGLENLTAEGVWSYYNRTLTNFTFTVNINDTNIINFLNGTNTSIMNSLNVINATTFATYLLLLNLTIGNVSVQAEVDWYEGELVLYNVSSQVQAFANVVKMQAENIQLVTTTDVCINSNTLEHRVNATNCIGQYCYDYNFTTTEICHYGCRNNICVPPPWYAILIAIAVALIIAGTIWWFTRKEGGEL